MSTFDAVLAQYEKNKNGSYNGAPQMSEADRLKKYFNTVLPKGQTTGEKRIRILPTKDGSTPFVEAYFHEIFVDGKKVKLYDPKQDGKRSPLNEVKEGLLMTKKPEDKELARQYTSKKFYVVKVIDRDNEADGPKFWRFKHASKGDGILDKIVPIWRNRGNLADVNEGRDLTLSLSLLKSNTGGEYTAVSSIIPEDKAPLHTDQTMIDKWVNDEMTWDNAYSKKSEDYLDLVANGETPKWDADLKKYVSMTVSDETIGSPKTTTTTTPKIVDPQEDDEPADDLPF